MRVSRSTLGACASLITLSLVTGASAASTCPTIEIICNGPVAIMDSAAFCGCVCYDLVAGTMSCSGSWQVSGLNRVTAYDDYVVSGPPTDTVLVFEAKLLMNGCVSGDACCGSARATIGEDGALVSKGFSYTDFNCHPARDSIEVTLRHSVGETFRLELRADVGGLEGGGGSITTRLVFADLPPGYSISSCRGFDQSFPTPVRHRTWGQLKALYR